MLSSTESDYTVLGECRQELKFIGMFLRVIWIGKVPGAKFEDYERAIFLVKNKQVLIHTKHIDVKYYFVQDLLEDKYLELVYTCIVKIVIMWI